MATQRISGILVSDVELDEPMVALRDVNHNHEMLLRPYALGEAACLLSSAVAGKVDDAHNEALGAAYSDVYAGNVGRVAFPVDDELRQRMERRSTERRIPHPYMPDRTTRWCRALRFPKVQNGITGRSHLTRIEVRDEDIRDGEIAFSGVNGGGAVDFSVVLSPGMAANLALVFAQFYVAAAPEGSVQALRRRIQAIVTTRQDPAPVERVAGFDMAPARRRRGEPEVQDAGEDVDDLLPAARP